MIPGSGIISSRMRGSGAHGGFGGQSAGFGGWAHGIGSSTGFSVQIVGFDGSILLHGIGSSTRGKSPAFSRSAETCPLIERPIPAAMPVTNASFLPTASDSWSSSDAAFSWYAGPNRARLQSPWRRSVVAYFDLRVIDRHPAF
jgi:hypothetical protein